MVFGKKDFEKTCFVSKTYSDALPGLKFPDLTFTNVFTEVIHYNGVSEKNEYIKTQKIRKITSVKTRFQFQC